MNTAFPETDPRSDIHVGERFRFPIRQTPRKSSDGKRFKFIISTFAEDRHGTRISQKGIDFSDFRRNGVVLFNHDLNIPIGRSVDTFLQSGNLVAEMEFDEEDEVAVKIRKKVEGGFLNAASIGFMVKAVEFDEETDTLIITESELLEFSIVSVPSNREALVTSRSLQRENEIRSLRSDISEIRDLVLNIRNDQSAPEGSGAEPVEASTSEAPAPESEGEPSDDAPVPEPIEAKTSEADLVHDEEAATEDSVEERPPEVQKAAKPSTTITLAEARAQMRSLVRRELGKE